MNRNTVDSCISIPAFYSGKSIFITGVTGFMGKVLLEKLLRSLPDIKQIFLLLRPKKNLNTHERLQKILSNPLFDLVRHKQPQCFDKLILINGDIGVKDLGLSAADAEMLIEETCIIFHVAANVKFDNTFKDAVIKNTRATRDICIIAERMKNLVALVYVSSAYTQVDKFVIDEILYPLNVDWRQMIQTIETLDEKLLEAFKMKYIGALPNQYIFSKRLAEQVIADYSKSLPCVIFRPSLVIATYREPIKGWLDNFNSSIGMFVGIGKGIIRVMNTGKGRANYVPVDGAIKSIIVAAWKRGTIMGNVLDDSPLVYNCTLSYCMCQNNKLIKKYGQTAVEKYPYESAIWHPQVILTTSEFQYYFLVTIVDVIPAFLMDCLLRLLNKKPRLLKMQRKISAASQMVMYFMLNDWKMKNNKFLSLSEEVPSDDQRDFGFKNDFAFDWYEMMENGLHGSKMYLLNESLDGLEAAKSHQKRWGFGIFSIFNGKIF